MGTKNNPKNRAAKVEKKKFNGKEVDPVLYCGNGAKYMAAKYSGTTDLVCNPNGKPTPWAEL